MDQSSYNMIKKKIKGLEESIKKKKNQRKRREIERDKKEQSELKKREREKRMAERQKKLQSKPKFPGGKNIKHKKLTKQKKHTKPKKLTKQKKKLYGENDKWPKEITYLIYKEDGLTTKEKLYISKTLKIKALRLFLNLRYPTDPVRYNSMNKDQLIKELKYNRYD